MDLLKYTLTILMIIGAYKFAYPHYLQKYMIEDVIKNYDWKNIQVDTPRLVIKEMVDMNIPHEPEKENPNNTNLVFMNEITRAIIREEDIPFELKEEEGSKSPDISNKPYESDVDRRTDNFNKNQLEAKQVKNKKIW